MQEKEYTVTLTESDLDKLIRTVRYKLRDQFKVLHDSIEPIDKSREYSIKEVDSFGHDLEVLHDSLEDTLYYLDVCTKLVKSKYECCLEENK